MHRVQARVPPGEVLQGGLVRTGGGSFEEGAEEGAHRVERGGLTRDFERSVSADGGCLIALSCGREQLVRQRRVLRQGDEQCLVKQSSCNVGVELAAGEELGEAEVCEGVVV